jgi:hypothetical protein
MSIYDDLQPVASELLAEFKQGTISLIQSVPGDGDDDDPGEPATTTTELDATVVGAPFKYVQAGFAVASDMLVTAAVVVGITPDKNDFIVIDGVQYKIIQDVSKPAAGTRVVWKFLVRK